MAISGDDFEKIFHNLKKCQKKVYEILPKNQPREKNFPIQKLLESFALCSGAFYHLNLYRIYHDDLIEKVSKTPSFEESWIFFNKLDSYDDFNKNALPQSELIKSELRSMCIANAAFRLSAAGESVCDVIHKIDLNECEICKSNWPYQRFFQSDRHTWNRVLLHGKNKKCVKIFENNTPLRNLSVLVALRDEYGHSEYDEGHECRTRIRKSYGDYIIEAEIEMLQICIATIRFMCEHHKEKLIKI